MSDVKTSALLFWKSLFSAIYSTESGTDDSNASVLNVYASGITEIEEAPNVELINFTLAFGKLPIMVQTNYRDYRSL